MLLWVLTMEIIMQEVYLGVTQSGKYGYFTDGFMTISCSEDAYKYWTTKEHIAYCKRFYLKYVERNISKSYKYVMDKCIERGL